jgi:phage head maturation protease
VAQGAVSGLSFGYRTVRARQGRWREIEVLELCEVSLVARPMQALARVHAVAGPAVGLCEAETAPPQPIAGSIRPPGLT